MANLIEIFGYNDIKNYKKTTVYMKTEIKKIKYIKNHNFIRIFLHSFILLFLNEKSKKK